MGLLIVGFFLNQDTIKDREKPGIRNKTPVFLGAVVFWLKIHIVPYLPERITHWILLSHSKT